MAEKKLTIKQKAQLYDNWLKYTAGKGWSDILKKPLEIKKVIDKLKLEKKDLQELNQVEHTKSFVSMAKLEKIKKSITSKEKLIGDLLHTKSELKKELTEYKFHDKNNKEVIKQLKEQIQIDAIRITVISEQRVRVTKLLQEKNAQLSQIETLHRAKTNPAIMWKKLNKIFDIK